MSGSDGEMMIAFTLSVCILYRSTVHSMMHNFTTQLFTQMIILETANIHTLATGCNLCRAIQ